VIYFPAEGKEYVFLPGSTGNITWKFDDDISALALRSWFFTRRGGSSERLVTIADDDRRKIRPSSLTGVEIEKPATLLLINVNQSYNGEYQFSLTKSSPTAETIGVQVFIASKCHQISPWMHAADHWSKRSLYYIKFDSRNWG
jgi:hypothetical protein